MSHTHCLRADGPAPAPVAPTTTPADTAQSPAFDKEVEDWIDKIQERMKGVKTIQADMTYLRVQGQLHDQQKRWGRMYYLPGPPARFSVKFDRLLVDDRMDKNKERWYIFDGTWFVEKIVDQKQFFKRQLVAPDAPPDQSNPLELGTGPFKIPVTLHKERIAKRFTVVKAEAGDNDPSNTIRLRFIPRPGQRMDFVRFDIWYDKDTLLPKRFESADDSKNVTTVDLMKTTVDLAVPPEVFDTGEPQEKDWMVEITPWKNSATQGPKETPSRSAQ